MEFYKAFSSISVFPHHMKQNVCGTRAKYRDGKKDTAVKVYTINQESVYLLISNVPAVGGAEELHALCDQYGIVDDFRPLDDYPCEEFTEAYLVKYNSFPSSRVAKRQLDDKSFFGSTLHVCYAPEFETVIETSLKLQERRKYVAWKTRKSCTSNPLEISGKALTVNKSYPSSSNAEKTVQQPYTYVWAGKEYTVYPSSPSLATNSSPEVDRRPKTTTSFLPRQVKQSASGDPNASVKTKNLNPGQKDSEYYSTISNMSQVDESSYLNTVSDVRSKISKVSVPNVRVSLKRKRRL